MAFHSTQCPSCNKNIQAPDDVDISRCMYCGQTIVIKDVVQITVGPNIENLLGMARTASAAGNVEEAMSYYNRVLELDPKISEAWAGKGRAAGWASSLVNMRFNEMLLAFNHAIANASESSKVDVISECVTEANRLIVTLYGMARNNMLQFVALPNTWTSYLAQVSQMLDALETIHQWAPADRITLENIVHLCKDNIEGVSYRDPYDNNISKVWHLSQQYESMMRTRLKSAADKLQILDPDYASPTVEVKKPDACFVVTATMGDADHPTVQFMRRFRDDWIMQQTWGPKFVKSYYEYGPIIANFIGQSLWLRKLSFVLIVAPAAFVARCLTASKINRTS